MNKKLTKIISIMLAVCCLCVFCLPEGSFAKSKRPAKPKKVKIVIDHNGAAASGVRVFAKYKKVKGAAGYQVKTTINYSGSDGLSNYVKKKTFRTKKTKVLLSENYTFFKVSVKVRAYKKKKGKKIYGKWTKVKTRTSF